MSITRKEAYTIAKTFLEKKNQIEIEQWTCKEFADFCKRTLGIDGVSTRIMYDVVGTRENCLENHQWSQRKMKNVSCDTTSDDIEALAYQVWCILDRVERYATPEFRELLERFGFTDKERSKP